MLPIQFIVIHSTNTPEEQDITSRRVIAQHTRPIREGGLGFNRPGFDLLIPRDGSLEVLVDQNSPTDVDLWGLTTGQHPISGRVLHIAYVGGRTLKGKFWKDTRTHAQRRAMETLAQYYVLRFPEVIILGRDDPYRNEESQNPSFNVYKWLELNGIPPKNRYRRPQRIIR